ncbi:hypothetical protein PInf_002665 [Phytophthora infestans]|nr:hypothetical protein PInf_002665 [Phytophthora infestans]
MLTELYAWDSEIEDVPTLAADDTKRDEDKAQDAYEQIVHAATGADASDVVLSLAAQLLHKHFFASRAFRTQCKKPRDEEDVIGGETAVAPPEREPKKAKHDDGAKEGKIVQLNRDFSNGGTPAWQRRLFPVEETII